MRDSAGFDLWADGYDQSVGRSDEADCYPFAGYKKLLNEIFNRVLSRGYAEVLDLGFGTAALTARLYEPSASWTMRGGHISKPALPPRTPSTRKSLAFLSGRP